MERIYGQSAGYWLINVMWVDWSKSQRSLSSGSIVALTARRFKGLKVRSDGVWKHAEFLELEYLPFDDGRTSILPIDRRQKQHAVWLWIRCTGKHLEIHHGFYALRNQLLVGNKNAGNRIELLGKLLRALTTTLVLKNACGTRLNAVPNSNNVRDWTIRN